MLCIATAVKNSTTTKSTSVDELSRISEHIVTTTFNEIVNGSTSSNRDRREAPSEYTIIKHKSRPSKRHPGYRARRRPKPKTVYGPPNFNYGSPISDYTLGYTSKGKNTKNGPTFPFSSSNLDTKYESDFVAPSKPNLYSGHNSYESTFKNTYISPPSSGLLPSLPLENYGSDTSFSYTPPPLDSYSNHIYKNFAEPPKSPQFNDLTGSGTHNVKSIPPSTNYGVPVAPIHQQSQPQNAQTSINQQYNAQTSINQPQDSYISNLYNSFSTPTTSQSQNFYNLPNLQPTYTNPGVLDNTGIGAIGTNGISGINANSGNVNSGIVNSGIGSSVSDPSLANIINRFNQNALNTLTFKSYATSQPPQVNYVPASVTISSSKDISLNRKPPSGKFAEPPRNYVQTPQTITSYDVPIQHDSSKTTYNIDAPENQFEPSIYKSPHNPWNQSPSTTTERNKYLPPILPTAYDQNQFNSFSNEHDISGNYNRQQSDFLDTDDGDYGSLFEVPHESKKIPKTKLTKTYGGTNLKSEDSSVESVEIPSDEYVDELIRVSTTTKPRTRRRRPRPTAQSTTPHILDTEDLRDAFSSGTVQYSLAVNPNGKVSKNDAKSKIATDKNFVLLSSANANRTWNRQYPKRQSSSFDPINDVKEFLRFDSSDKTNSSNRGIEILSIQQSKSHSYYAGTVAPPEPFKHKGINARYDQPKYDDSMFNVVSTNVRVGNKGNSKSVASVTGSRRTKKQNFEESKEFQDDKEIDPIFWHGERLPDNHKLAKRIA